MNPEIKKMWVEALRSGEYKQGYGQLKYKNSITNEYNFCPIGVLCELAVKAKVLSPDFDKHEYSTPYMVISWAEVNPNVRIFNKESVISLNDRQKLDFVKIAALIEASCL